MYFIIVKDLLNIQVYLLVDSTFIIVRSPSVETQTFTVSFKT